MLKFQVFRDGNPPLELDLTSAYLAGADSIPIRGDLSYSGGELRCRKRAAGPSALALLWEVQGFGAVLLETTRLPERPEPYILNLELARSRMMRLIQKREEWGFFDLPEAQGINDKFNEARDLLVEAILQQDDPPAASRLADRCLALVMPLSEQAAVVHAELLLQRRITTKSFPRNVFGCHADLQITNDQYRKKLMACSDFVMLPVHWKTVEPQEQSFTWGQVDEWMEFLRRAKLPVVFGPLVSFTDLSIPDWLYIWEHDYEQVRGLLYEHIERTVTRYGAQVVLWNVLSGLHVNAHFSFTFDQLMDLTRMAIGVVKRILPNAQTMIEITQPWGEYYARNQRSIPPLVYADMVVQSGVTFDMFGLALSFGVPRDGCWQRDLFQISALIDRFAALGKPVAINRIEVPSHTADDAAAAGVWRQPWNEPLQAKWLEAVTNIVLSKPFVEAVCWRNVMDRNDNAIPFSGLCNADLTPKKSQATWISMRRAVMVVRQGGVKTGDQPKPVSS